MKIAFLPAILALAFALHSGASATEEQPPISLPQNVQVNICQSASDGINYLEESLLTHFGTLDITEETYRAIRCGSTGNKRSILVYVKDQEPFKRVFNLIWGRNKIKTDEDACCLYNYSSRKIELSTGNTSTVERLQGETQKYCSNPAAYSNRQCGINI